MFCMFKSKSQSSEVFPIHRRTVLKYIYENPKLENEQPMEMRTLKSIISHEILVACEIPRCSRNNWECARTRFQIDFGYDMILMEYTEICFKFVYSKLRYLLLSNFFSCVITAFEVIFSTTIVKGSIIFTNYLSCTFWLILTYSLMYLFVSNSISSYWSSKYVDFNCFNFLLFFSVILHVSIPFNMIHFLFFPNLTAP